MPAIFNLFDAIICDITKRKLVNIPKHIVLQVDSVFSYKLEYRQWISQTMCHEKI